MKRLLRWIAVLVLLLLVAAIAVPTFVRMRVRQKPSWYPQTTLNAESRAIAADNANNKLLGAIQTAGRAHAKEIEIRHASRITDAPSTLPVDPITVELTDDEMNAFFLSWDQRYHWREQLSAHLQDPVIVIQDHELIIAGTVKDYWNAVVSLHFEMKLENGKMKISLVNVMAGTLPVPQSVYGPYLQRLNGFMEKKLPALRQDAEIGPRGWANSSAVGAAMGELLINVLNDQPSEPALFIPENFEKIAMGRNLPMRVTGLDLSNKTLSITMEPMKVDDREALLQHIRGPAATETALGK